MKSIKKIVKNIIFTDEGFEKIKNEREKLLEERKDAVKELSRARELGDLSENGLYKAARARLSSIDSRINRLSFLIKFGKIITAQKNSQSINIGSVVTIRDEKKQYEYNVVGEYEADPSSGKISNLSPIGKTLIGKTQGDIIEVKTPDGTKIYKIVEVKNE